MRVIPISCELYAVSINVLLTTLALFHQSQMRVQHYHKISEMESSRTCLLDRIQCPFYFAIDKMRVARSLQLPFNHSAVHVSQVDGSSVEPALSARHLLALGPSISHNINSQLKPLRELLFTFLKRYTPLFGEVWTTQRGSYRN